MSRRTMTNAHRISRFLADSARYLGLEDKELQTAPIAAVRLGPRLSVSCARAFFVNAAGFRDRPTRPPELVRSS